MRNGYDCTHTGARLADKRNPTVRPGCAASRRHSRHCSVSVGRCTLHSRGLAHAADAAQSRCGGHTSAPTRRAHHLRRPARRSMGEGGHAYRGVSGRDTATRTLMVNGNALLRGRAFSSRHGHRVGRKFHAARSGVLAQRAGRPTRVSEIRPPNSINRTPSRPA